MWEEPARQCIGNALAACATFCCRFSFLARQMLFQCSFGVFFVHLVCSHPFIFSAVEHRELKVKKESFDEWECSSCKQTQIWTVCVLFKQLNCFKFCLKLLQELPHRGYHKSKITLDSLFKSLHSWVYLFIISIPQGQNFTPEDVSELSVLCVEMPAAGTAWNLFWGR